MRSLSPGNLTTELSLTTKKFPLTNRCQVLCYRLSNFYLFHFQSFFSSSEKPDFNPTIPEFTSEKFHDGERWPFLLVVDQKCSSDATTTEGSFGQSHSNHGHPLSHDSGSHAQTHFHSDDIKDTTLQPFQHDSEEFTIKPFSHNSFNGRVFQNRIMIKINVSGVKWTPSSPDPNADSWTTPSPVRSFQVNRN